MLKVKSIKCLIVVFLDLYVIMYCVTYSAHKRGKMLYLVVLKRNKFSSFYIVNARLYSVYVNFVEYNNSNNKETIFQYSCI